MRAMQRHIAERLELGRVGGDLPVVQPPAARGDDTTDGRSVRPVRRPHPPKAPLSDPAAFLRPAVPAGSVAPTSVRGGHADAPRGAMGVTPTQYCQPSPCPNGHPMYAVRRIRWLFALASRWRCGECGTEWDRPASADPPSLAQQCPLYFRRLRELTDGLPAVERLRRAMRFWTVLTEEEA